MSSVVSPQPSDISHLKKSVPLSPARCITFAAVAATLLTLGCTDASIVPLSLNRSVVLANNVRKDSGEIRTLADENGKAREKGLLRSNRTNTAQYGEEYCAVAHIYKLFNY